MLNEEIRIGLTFDRNNRNIGTLPIFLDNS